MLSFGFAEAVKTSSHIKRMVIKVDKTVVPVMEAVFDRNDKIAALTNEALTKQGVFAVNVMGAPGIGKTSSLIHIIKHLEKPCFVIEGDIESDIDTKMLLDCGIKAVQIGRAHV